MISNLSWSWPGYQLEPRKGKGGSLRNSDGQTLPGILFKPLAYICIPEGYSIFKFASCSCRWDIFVFFRRLVCLSLSAAVTVSRVVVFGIILVFVIVVLDFVLVGLVLVLVLFCPCSSDCRNLDLRVGSLLSYP